MLKRFFRMAVVGMVLAVMLAGCSSHKSAEKIYDHLEKGADIEQGFIKDQKKMIDKEKKEQHLYDQIIKLNMKKTDQIRSKSKQAAKLANEREELLHKEKDTLDKANRESSAVKETVDKLKGQEEKSKAKEIIKVMKKRHDAFDDLTQKYKKSVDLDKRLYKRLKNKDLKQKELQKLIDRINSKYKAINRKTKQFNRYTKKYNKAKKAFYKAADLDVADEHGK